MKTIYRKIKAIGLRTMTDYLSDLTEHDRKSCRQMKPGDIAFWCCIPTGSHFIPLLGDVEPCLGTALNAKSALQWAEAIEEVRKPAQWYLLEKTGEAVLPVDYAFVRGCLRRRWEALEAARTDKVA